MFAVYEELTKAAPKRQFTIGIVDDVTELSLEEKPSPNTAAEGTIECKFWGLGGDGTVGDNKYSIKIIGDQAIRAPINKADFVTCHVPAYIVKGFPMVRDVKDSGTAFKKFEVPASWATAEDKAASETLNWTAVLGP